MAPGEWVCRDRQMTDPQQRIFCFPYAGGGSPVFTGWQERAPGWLEVCPIQLPGRWHRLREAPFTRLGPLVSAAARALEPLLDRPFSLFGHSLGALVAYELARHLGEASRPPAALFVAGHRAPHLPPLYPPIHQLPDQRFVKAMQARYRGISRGVLEQPDLLELLLPAMKADMEVYDTYHYTPGPPLGCSIMALGGLQDTIVSRGALEAWEIHTTGRFGCRSFEGDHFFIHAKTTELLAVLAEILAANPPPD